MRLKFIFLYPLFCLMLVNIVTLQAQTTCTAIGQNPSTAFPVCGTKIFSQEIVPKCGGRAIIGPPCDDGSGGLADVNPYWYKFTCYKGGTLGFKITPKAIIDDYDWQLFDVTGHSPDDVFTDPSLYVCRNWSGEGGVTGASSAGTSFNTCGGLQRPLWSKMPTLIEGHQYLLLLSHFTDEGQSGYDLEFTGGTADITSPGIPAITSATYHCVNNSISLKLSKKTLCKTLTTQGTEFILTRGMGTVVAAAGVNCSNGFDSDSLVITFSGPLAPGDYTIAVKNGSDNNTVLDVCGNGLAVGESADFSIPVPPAVMLKDVVSVGCAPDIIKIALSVPVRCGTIAADGSDFRITGTPAGSIRGAAGNCDANNLTDTIFIQLTQPLVREGDYTIRLVNRADGRPILGECGQPVTIGQFVDFHTVDTVSADFDFALNRNCKVSTLNLTHNGDNDVNYWRWTFDSTDNRYTQNVTKIYGNFGVKHVSLLVSNGTCTDSVARDINLERTLAALFAVDPGPYCPMDIVIAKNESFGNIISYLWDYGDGRVSTAPDPIPQQYFPTRKEQDYTIRLIVEDNLNCQDTVDHTITAVMSCYIDVPTAFSPNHDGMNDYLYPLSAYKAIDLQFSVYNRVGQLVFQTTDWTKKWDGTVKGKPADVGSYVWMLRYTMKESGKKVFRKGTTVLLR